MTSNLMKTGRVTTLGIALLIGSLGVNTVMAQTATETPTPTTQGEKDSGFDDWDLLGLLGLAGLACGSDRSGPSSARLTVQWIP